MIVIALIGNHTKADEAAVNAIRDLVPAHCFRHISLGHLTSEFSRLNQCCVATQYCLPDDIVMVITGCQTKWEVAELRGRGIHIFHHYHCLSHSIVPICKTDLLLSERKDHPANTLTTVEAFSECVIRNRQKRAARARRKCA